MIISIASSFRNFRRKENENIDQLIARYEFERRRAFDQAGVAQTWPSCALDLCKHANLGTETFQRVLQPLEGRLPQNRDEYVGVL